MYSIKNFIIIDNFTKLIKVLQQILTEKLWVSQSGQEKKMLFQLFIIWTISGLVSILFLLFNLFFSDGNYCIICNIAFIIMNILAIACTINGKVKCSTNLVYAVPLILYAYYISDFNEHPPYIDTVYNTVSWLVAGLLVLLFYSDTNRKIWFYYLLSFITIGFQLLKAGHLLY